MRSLKRMISVCVLLCMIISLIPLTTFANDAPAQSVPGRVLLDPGMVCSTVWVDGVDYAVRSSGGQRYIDLPADADPGSLVIYEHHIGDPSDIHTQYPIGMQVWSLEKNDDGTFTPRQVEELTDILKYSGSSIRITGNKGIRMITSMDRGKKAALAGDGLAGYKLLEYGTVLAWSDELKDGDPLILGPEYAKHNYAYKRDEADPIFAYKNDLMQYTNVLVGFSLEECSDDIAMRPYMILEGPDGEQLTVYGGIVHRSIGYIAWQNRNDFTPGTAAYNYVWEIIRQVYAQITFQTNGGSQLEYMLVEKGMIPQLPSEPEKEGFTFGGWYTDEALRNAFDPTAPLTEDVTLYARWDAPMSRGEWIEQLVNAYGFPRTITGDLETFADISDSPYRSAIETAVVYNVLEPDPDGNFDPEGYASREFAAVTAVNAMGYDPTGSFDCEDIEDITEPAAVGQAIASGFMDLEDGFFYPARPLNQWEADRILERLEEEFNSAQGDDDEEPRGMGYLEGVVNKPSFDWQSAGDRLIVPEGEPIPEVGTIITFGLEKAIRVESVETVNGQTTVTYSTPELYEFLDFIDLEGDIVPTVGDFVPAPGITVTQNNNGGIATFGFADDWFDIPAESVSTGIDITLEPEEPIELTDNLELNVSVDLKIPTVSYKFDVDFDWSLFNDTPTVLVKNAYITVSNDVTAHVTIGNGFDTGDEEFDDSIFDDIGGEREINLGSIPLIGIDGLCLEVEVDMIITAEGKFDIVYNVYGTAGAQVWNNQVKNITTMQSSMSLGIEAEVSAGPQVGFEAEVFGEDLFAFSFGAGGKAAGSVYLRESGMVCMDGNAHVYMELNLLEDCLIDDWLNVGITIPIWDEDNSPFRVSGHWEDLEKVEECTFEECGTIKGTVVNADNRNQYISGAVITAFSNSDFNVPVATATSDANGRYTILIPGGGTVLLRISANGYIPVDRLETVGTQQEIFVETQLMVEGSENSNETGTIGGYITNAVTGGNISGVSMTIYKGWNMTSGQSVKTTTTNSSGHYSVTLPIGNYTIVLEKDGYVSNHFNVAVTKTGNNNSGASMNPDGDSSFELGDMRIVLRWGDRPSDLDSHLWGPTVDGEGVFHTYYSNKNYYANGTTQAFLDRDDTNYYGPETTTVYNMAPNGVYSFFVHDFSNRSYSGSTAMANSGAYIEVYIGEAKIATYHVPTSGVGNVWHVFDFDATTGTIRGVNTFSSNSNPGTVGSPYMTFGLEPEEVPDKEYAEEPVEEPTEEPAEDPVEEPTEEPAEEPVEGPTEEPTEEPAEEPVEEPSGEPAEEPADTPPQEDVPEEGTE